MTASPYLGSGSRIVWPPASVPPASRTLAEAPAKIVGEDVAWQVFGERRDRQREQHPAAHREDVGQRIGRGDLAVGPRVVDERREEVERPDDREVVADAVGGGVIGRLQAGDQLVGARPRRPPEPASASASRSAPSFAAQPPQSVRSVRRSGSAAARRAVVIARS